MVLGDQVHLPAQQVQMVVVGAVGVLVLAAHLLVRVDQVALMVGELVDLTEEDMVAAAVATTGPSTAASPALAAELWLGLTIELLHRVKQFRL
jgi:hypothetical protein